MSYLNSFPIQLYSQTFSEICLQEHQLSNLDAEHTDHIILEKIDSQRAPGEFTPVRNASPAMSTDERLDESKLESGSLRSSAEPGGRQPITHRPTGLRVFPSLI